MDFLLDIFFPKSCTICSRKGVYLCERCRKLFKRNLPECYVCRRVSSEYRTHDECKKNGSLDRVFVCWEYNDLSSDILKKFKYSGVTDISETLCLFFLECLNMSNIGDLLKNTLLVNIPISDIRMNERGFNQTYDLTEHIAKSLGLEFESEMMGRKYSRGHQALRDSQERKEDDGGDFFFKKVVDVSKFKSITLVDDVITTGSTLEKACIFLRETFGQDLEVNALCIFRGKPNYNSVSISNTAGSSG